MIVSFSNPNCRKEKSWSNWILLWCTYSFISLLISFLFETRNNLIAHILYFILSRTDEILFLFCIFTKKTYKYILRFMLLYEIFILIFAQSVFFVIQSIFDAKALDFLSLFVLLEVLAGLINILLVWLIFRKKIFRNNYNKFFYLPGNMYAFVILTLIFAVILENIICGLGNVATIPNLSDHMMIIIEKIAAVIVLPLLSILVIFLLLSHNSQSYYKNLTEILSYQVNLQIQHYEDLKEHEEAMSAFRHDYKNMMLCLRALLEVNDTEQALQYIDQMHLYLQSTRKIRLIDSGNYIADALITEKLQKASQTDTNILFEGFIPSSRLDNLDICIILGNALDNAIEACAMISGSKSIYITSDIKNNMWLLCIKNPTIRSIQIRKNHIDTTKSDTASHGFGLHNIKTIVNRNHGQLTLKCEDNVFSLDIAMQLKSD